MNMPGFTAEVSLLHTDEQYQSLTEWAEAVIGDSIIPQLRCTEWVCDDRECICTRIVRN